jgi:DNA gyrase subunit B
MSRVTDNAVMYALLHHPEIDLSNQDKATFSANSLAAFVHSAKISADYDEDNERYRLRIDRISHGNLNTSYLDQDFLHSGDYAQIIKTYQVFDGLFKTGASIKRGEKQRFVNSFKQALEWLLEDAKKGLSINRYKGLGEMNPDQLWETTMDPANRRLLRMQIEDSIQTDEIFTTLMGDVVEPRRAFIENNALRATNIDV